MKKATVLTLALIVGAAGLVPAVSEAGHQSKATKMSQPDIVDTAVAAGSFTTLAAALEAAGLVEVLKGDGPFTVFAPNDEAFAKLPAGTVESLLEPANRHQLQDILKYHVVAGSVSGTQAAQAASAATVEGSEVAFAIVDGRLTVNDAQVLSSDIGAGNGVIHVIDSVLLPN